MGPLYRSPQKRVIVIQVNGAEYAELAAEACSRHITVPAVVRARCGLDLWAARPRKHCRPVHLPQDWRLRTSVTICLSPAEYDAIQAAARAQGLSAPQYIRRLCGFMVRWTSAPGSEERRAEEIDALRRMERLSS